MDRIFHLNISLSPLSQEKKIQGLAIVAFDELNSPNPTHEKKIIKKSTFI